MLKKIIALISIIILLVSCSSPQEDTVVVLDENDSIKLLEKKSNIDEKKPAINENIFKGDKAELKTLTEKLMGIALNNKNEVYIIDQGKHKLFKFSKNGDFISEFGYEGSGDEGFKEPKYIIFKDGLIYIADTWNHRIKTINEKGETINILSSSFFGPKGISIFNNYLYVADTGNHTIKVFDDKNKLINQIGSRGAANGKFFEPTGLTHDDKGNLYVVDSGNNRVCKFNNKDKFDSCWPVTKWDKGSGGKECWIAYHDNNLYLSDPVNLSVRTFTTEGKELKPIIEKIAEPSGIVIKNNKLYAVDFLSTNVVVKEINRK